MKWTTKSPKPWRDPEKWHVAFAYFPTLISSQNGKDFYVWWEKYETRKEFIFNDSSAWRVYNRPLGSSDSFGIWVYSDSMD